MNKTLDYFKIQILVDWVNKNKKETTFEFMTVWERTCKKKAIKLQPNTIIKIPKTESVVSGEWTNSRFSKKKNGNKKQSAREKLIAIEIK